MHGFRGSNSGPPLISEPDRVGRVAMAINGMGVFVWDLESGVMRYDDVGLSVMGIRPHEWDGRLDTLGTRMVQSELPAVRARVDRAVRERTSFSLYFRVRLRDGSLRWTHTQGNVISDGEGRAVRVVGVIRDASQELLAVDQTEEVRRARGDRRRQAAIVGHLSDALAPTLTVGDVTRAVTSTRLLEQLGAATVALALSEGGRVVMVGSNGTAEEWIRNLHLARSTELLPFSEVIRTRKPVFITSRAEFAARYPGLRAFLDRMPDATAAAYLPLVAQGSAIGALGLSYNGKTCFTSDERTVLSAVSSAIAQSLQRALLYDKEHELAAGLQEVMLPASTPRMAGTEVTTRYCPAHSRGDIGGDWYDTIPLPDGRIIAVVGDVQGHDVTAAAVMGQLRVALRAYAGEGHPPASIMARTSAFLTELDTERFATCVLALIDPRTGLTVSVRAGHPEPVLRRPDGSVTRLDVPGGLPLGLDGPSGLPVYPEAVNVLEPGSTLLLCTDGLIETRTADLDQGAALLLDALRTGPERSGPLADHLLDTMGAYTGQEDDVALLLLRRTADGPATGRQFTATLVRTDPDALHCARHRLRSALHDWSMDPLGDIAELLACELATNALLHTGGDATLTAGPVGPGGRALRLTVADGSSACPRRRAAPEGATSGHGLVLVEELATAWGVTPCGTGKYVWCEIALPPG
ncbi:MULTISPECIES: SpoIIE family protein phosphatase [unclassified Streptomyces]|uniref:SpoIIE family protein phosphatase n=1 Tax=Streptomyces TaxID=1883 RepID=UPI00068FA42E|nr:MULTISPECIES: SpoIIE family protein phosphatase [unclassified Streptomyces]